MADFVQKSLVKSSVRKFASSIPDSACSSHLHRPFSIRTFRHVLTTPRVVRMLRGEPDQLRRTPEGSSMRTLRQRRSARSVSRHLPQRLSTLM